MYLLAIETTGAFASVALLEDDCVLEHIQGHDRFSHLQNLMPQVKEVLENHKLSINDVSAIAVSKGPGSFTGIRIGVSSTRALCQVLGVPGVPVSSLEALAMRVADLPGEKRRSTGDTLDDRTWICPILDARRSQVYGGGYVLQNGYPIEAFKGGAYTVEDFLEKTDECDRILLLGDGTDAYGEKIAEASGGGRTQAGRKTGGGSGEAGGVKKIGRPIWQTYSSDRRISTTWMRSLKSSICVSRIPGARILCGMSWGKIRGHFIL